MGLMDFIKGELIDVIEWTDDSRDTLSYRFPDDDKAIKNGAQLIVRESQQVQFVYLGEFGDTFGPGKHTLTTDNIPVLTKLKSWKYGFNSPFKADVYYVNTRLFTGNKWGTANPIMMRDDDLGIVRARAFGTFDFRIVDPKLFLKEVAGSDHNFRLDEFADTMRSRIVSVFADALASAKIPVFDVASRYSELGEALLPLINPVIEAKYGIEMASFILENVSVPPEVEQAIDKRSSMAAVGNLNDYVKFQMAQGMEKGGSSGGVATEMAVGLSIAQQIMQQQGMPRRGGREAGGRRPRSRCRTALARPTSPRRSASPKRTCMAIIESGELAAKKIGSYLADQALRAGRVSGEVGGIRRRATPIARLRSPPSRSIRAPPAARRRSGIPAKQMLVCPFCGTESPFTVDAATGRDRRARSRHARCARCPDEARGWQTEKRTVQCQSCKAVSVFDPKRVGQSCELLRLARARRLRRRSSRPIRPQSLLPFKVAETRGPRADPPLVQEQVARARQPEVTRARRHASTASTSRTGPSTRRSSARGKPTPATTTTRPKPTATTRGNTQTRQVRHIALGAGVRRRSSTSSTTSRSRGRRACRTRC